MLYEDFFFKKAYMSDGKAAVRVEEAEPVVDTQVIRPLTLWSSGSVTSHE